MNLNELNNTIEFLQKLKIEEEKKQVEELNIKIKEEIISYIENELLNFESDSILKFMEETKKRVCYEYNFIEIIESIKDKIKIDIWEL